MNFTDKWRKYVNKNGKFPFAPFLRRAEFSLLSQFRESNEVLSLHLQDAMKNACLSQTSHHFNIFK